MAITQTISAMPSAPVRTQTQTAFDAAMAALLAAWPTNITEINAMASQMNALAASMNAVAAGTALNIPLTFDTATSDLDPGNGKLRLDNSTQNAATTIRTDLIGADGSDWTAVEDQFSSSTSTVKGHITLHKQSDPTKFLVFAVTGVASPSGYRNISVTPVASSSTNPFGNGEALTLKFTRTGDKGDAGAAGAAAGVRSPRTSNTILGASDDGKWIDTTSGTYTQTITAAATLGSSWKAFVGNSGTGFITLDPNASETITVNGAALTTWVLWPGELGLLACDGTGFYYQQIKKGQITQTVGAGVGSVSFSTGLAYRRRMSLSIEDMQVSSGGANLNLTINGTTWDDALFTSNTGGGTGSAGPTATAGLDGTVGLLGSAAAANRFYSDINMRVGVVGTQAVWVSHFKSNSSVYNHVQGVSVKSSVSESALSSIAVAVSTGTITAGTLVLREL